MSPTELVLKASSEPLAVKQLERYLAVYTTLSIP